MKHEMQVLRRAVVCLAAFSMFGCGKAAPTGIALSRVSSQMAPEPAAKVLAARTSPLVTASSQPVTSGYPQVMTAPVPVAPQPVATPAPTGAASAAPTVAAPLPAASVQPVATPVPSPVWTAAVTPQPVVTPVPSPSIRVTPTPAATPVAPATPAPQPTPVLTPTPTVTPQPTPLPTPVPTPVPTPTPSPTGAGIDPMKVLQLGVAGGLAGEYQLPLLSDRLAQSSAGDLAALQNLLQQTGSPTEAIMIVKSFAAGETIDTLTPFAAAIRSQDEATLVALCTMHEAHDLTQQWQDACGPAIVQTIAGEVDPRYAWALKTSGDYKVVDPNGSDQTIAAQEAQWLSQYGGLAVPRGSGGGAGIAINDLLTDQITPMTGVQYSPVAVGDTATAMTAIAKILAQGYSVPLHIDWSAPGTGEYGHFMVALGARSDGALLIHDPWSGDTGWVTAKDLAKNAMPAVTSFSTHLTHYYAPTAPAN